MWKLFSLISENSVMKFMMLDIWFNDVSYLFDLSELFNVFFNLLFKLENVTNYRKLEKIVKLVNFILLLLLLKNIDFGFIGKI